jgi:hypothetical protein
MGKDYDAYSIFNDIAERKKLMDIIIYGIH